MLPSSRKLDSCAKNIETAMAQYERYELEPTLGLEGAACLIEMYAQLL